MAIRGKPYRGDFSAELARIEARRVAAGVTIDELAGKAGMNERTYRRIKSSGLAFRRHARALAMAMRTLEGDRKREPDIFPFGSASSSALTSGSASAPKGGRAGS